MTPDQLTAFYEAALTAGSILFGFVGTFLSFRIQREANYYRQPVLDFRSGEDEGSGQDVEVGLSHFTSSLALIILAGLGAMIFGMVLPLAALAQLKATVSSPESIVAGIVGSLALVVGYFLDELFHYRIIFRLDRKGWKRERWIVIGTLAAAVAGAGVVFYAVNGSL